MLADVDPLFKTQNLPVHDRRRTDATLTISRFLILYNIY
jgi:hypothetical protein